jgi:hypothetical protein
MDTMTGLIISFTCGALIGLAISSAIYRRDFNFDRALVRDTVRVREKDIPTLHWLAENGFSTLLIRGSFHTREDAQRAHIALERLEYVLPTKADAEASFDRTSKISMFFPDGPLSEPHQLLRELWEAEERSRTELEKKIYARYRKIEISKER